jgi:hypothetical protein
LASKLFEALEVTWSARFFGTVKASLVASRFEAFEALGAPLASKLFEALGVT